MESQQPQSVASPDSDVSPKTNAPRDTNNEYFPIDSNVADDGSSTSVKPSEDDGDNSSAKKSSVSFAIDPDLTRTDSLESTGGESSSTSARKDLALSRKLSTSSVTFRSPADPSMPQGEYKQTNAKRIRNSSPPPPKK
ncbi:Fc.00g002700.m01.CDS01 [Cosmosporella sp. VM-42]